MMRKRICLLLLIVVILIGVTEAALGVISYYYWRPFRNMEFTDVNVGINAGIFVGVHPYELSEEETQQVTEFLRGLRLNARETVTEQELYGDIKYENIHWRDGEGAQHWLSIEIRGERAFVRWDCLSPSESLSEKYYVEMEDAVEFVRLCRTILTNKGVEV